MFGFPFAVLSLIQPVVSSSAMNFTRHWSLPGLGDIVSTALISVPFVSSPRRAEVLSLPSRYFVFFTTV